MTAALTMVQAFTQFNHLLFDTDMTCSWWTVYLFAVAHISWMAERFVKICLSGFSEPSGQERCFPNPFPRTCFLKAGENNGKCRKTLDPETIMCELEKVTQ